MNNMSKIIKEHKKVTPKCNCRKKAECLTEGNCQVNDAVYKCDVTRSLPKKVYLGLAEREWKSCFYNHKRYSNETILSNYMWYLKSA